MTGTDDIIRTRFLRETLEQEQKNPRQFTDEETLAAHRQRLLVLRRIEIAVHRGETGQHIGVEGFLLNGWQARYPVSYRVLESELRHGVQPGLVSLAERIELGLDPAPWSFTMRTPDRRH